MRNEHSRSQANERPETAKHKIIRTAVGVAAAASVVIGLGKISEIQDERVRFTAEVSDCVREKTGREMIVAGIVQVDLIPELEACEVEVRSELDAEKNFGG